MFENMSPEQAFLLAYGSGLMGTRGPGGFGRAGLMGLEASDRSKRTQLLASEDARREKDAEIARQMHKMQMDQLKLAIEDDQRTRAIYGKIAERFANRQAPGAPVPSVPAGPLNPDMSPVDAAMIMRNNSQAAAAQPAAGGFPFGWDDVLAAKYATRGKVDLTGDYKDSMKTEEIKPGTYQRDVYGRERFVDSFDTERGVQGNPATGLRPIAGAQQIAADRAGAIAGAQAGAQAEYDMVTVTDPRPNAPSFGKQITIPRAMYRQMISETMGVPMPGQQQQVPMPAPAAQPPPPTETLRPGAPPPPQPQPPPKPQQGMSGVNSGVNGANVNASRAAVNGAMAAGDPAMTDPGTRYREAVTNRMFLVDQINTEQNPAKRRELELELAAQEQVIRSLGKAPPAGQAGPQAAPAPGQAGTPQPAGPRAPVAAAPLANAQREIDIGQNKVLGKVASTLSAYQGVQGLIDRTLPKISRKSTGFGSLLSGLPESDALAVKANLLSIEANQAFNALQEMRDNSPTGGALGQVAIQELEMLKSKIASLNQAQTPEQINANLILIRDWYDDSAKRVREAYKRDFGVYPPLPDLTGGRGQSEIPIDSLMKRYGGK